MERYAGVKLHTIRHFSCSKLRHNPPTVIAERTLVMLIVAVGFSILVEMTGLPFSYTFAIQFFCYLKATEHNLVANHVTSYTVVFLPVRCSFFSVQSI